MGGAANIEGTGPVRKLLVANRGEIARRIFRSCRSMGISTVAVHSDPDASAPFVREADEAVPLGGSTPAESYLRQEALVEAARRSGADSVHPGYGFLAENADFARACAQAGLTFVGPTPEAIEAMGSKVRARALMSEAGVPVLPGVELDGRADLSGAGQEVGFPLLAKASAGGGGKGMRIVADPADLDSAVESARREAEAAFGDGTIFLERYLERPRHVEIQVMADAHGNTVSLGERECSIQRRHQKVVEEAPSPAVGPELRERMGEAAVRAAEAVGYRGAGTVEFLLAEDGSFFFLEMNTRLQVEHPVTELVTGLDLVALQIAAARGDALEADALDPDLYGHAIEVRLYAEDPLSGFLPQTGTLERLRFPDDAGLRVDTGVEDGSEVSVHYDPMIAKVIAWDSTREGAALRLADGLARTELHGLVTNRDFLVRTLRHPAFLAGETDTGFLERHDPAELGAPLADRDAATAHAAAAALAAQAANREGAEVLPTIPSGWRNNPSGPQQVVFELGGEELEVGYRLSREGRIAELRVGEQELESPRLWHANPDLVDLELGGVRRRYRVRRSSGTHHVDSPLGHTALVEVPRFASEAEAAGEGAIVAPMPGSVVRVGAAEGEEVSAGSVIVVLEAMKMEHELTAPVDGTVAEVKVEAGSQVEPGAVLAMVEPREG